MIVFTQYPFPMLLSSIPFGCALQALFPRRTFRGLCYIAAWICCFVAADVVGAEKWDPVAPEELSAEKSANFPEADAEILLSSHILDESADRRLIGVGSPQGTDLRIVTKNFVRAKIYTKRGVEEHGKFFIRYPDGSRLSDLDARVVKRSGVSVCLQNSDFIESVLEQDDDGDSWKQVAFVFSNLEAGDVIEYRWNEHNEDSFWLRYCYVQSEIPTREYSYYVKELLGTGSVWWLNCKEERVETKHGLKVTFRNIPAFTSEDHMPPMREQRGWLYITKTYPSLQRDAEIWPFLSHEWADEFNQATKPKDIIKDKAAAIVAGATSDEEKLRRIYEFCQNDIVNTDYMMTAKLRSLVDKHKDEDALSPVKVLTVGRGRADEVNRLFAALVRAISFEVKEARNARNTDLMKISIPHSWAFFVNPSVAVKLAGRWHFFDPGSYLIPFGMISWRAENATALICDLKKVEYAEIPTSTAEQNRQQYRARLVLDADGTLEGDVEESFTGQLASKRKLDAWVESEEKISQDFSAEVVKRLPNAEVTQVAWTNLHTNSIPLKATYHVRVPGYAEKVGKRLVVPPGYFRAGKSPEFTAPSRKFPIFFPYPWSEHDDVEIAMPRGFVFDAPSAPSPVGNTSGALGSSYQMHFDQKKRILTYQRDFSLGGNGACRFKVESYPALKELFEQLHKSDSHVLVLKPAIVAASKGTESHTEAAAPTGQP